MPTERTHQQWLEHHLIADPTDAPHDVAAMSPQQRRDIVEAFRLLLEGLYCHLPQKQASYGFDPLQRLKLLAEQAGNANLGDVAFHREMAHIVTSLRDAHTRYLVQRRDTPEVALLPLLVERYVDDDGQHRFIASHVLALDVAQKQAFAKVGFGPDVDILHWNGRPIERAVDLYAEYETGGRPDARRARALESLTIRPLKFGLIPDETWVNISFRGHKGEQEIRLTWKYALLPPEDALPDGSAGAALAFNPVADSARQVKKMLYAANVWVAEQNAARARSEHLLPTTGGAPAAGRTTATEALRRQPPEERSAVQINVEDHWAADRTGVLTGDFGPQVYAREVNHDGRRYGYLRIHSFQVANDLAFVAEVAEMISHLSPNGLIIDLRSNPGGSVWAAEGLLQLFTPNTIEPTRFTMLATDMTRAMAVAPQNRGITPWAESLRSAVASGGTHSRSEPLTRPARCNNLGQRFGGPVVAIVDANTYSAGDLFAAGFVDNGIGKLICTDEATGGGGANVWMPSDVTRALSGTGINLPDMVGASFTISARRAERIGAQDAGIEDAGVTSVFRRPLTRRDLTDKNRDLLDYACRHLATETRSSLQYKLLADDDSASRLEITAAGLTRLSLTYDRTVVGTINVDLAPIDAPMVETMVLPDDWTQHRVEILGHVHNDVRQRRLIPPSTVRWSDFPRCV